jgi:two-component system cell cycle response regulator
MMESGEETRAIDRKNLAALKVQKEVSRSACFIVIAGKRTGAMYKLEAEEVIIGRSEDASFLVDDDGVSRQHAKIVRHPDGSVAIVDLNSTNGTFCNGVRVETRVLKDGDKIQIGTTTIIKFSFQDALEQEFQRQQYESATRDPLTHCYNKRFFLDRLPSELAFAKRHNKPLSLALMDIDHFKKINDSHGHLAGDLVLRSLGSVLEKRLRAEDIFVRYGGEEFALVMRETPLPNALLAAERVRGIAEKTVFVYEGKKLRITLSIGVAAGPAPGIDTVEDLLKAADKNLYKAKQTGRNKVVGQ